VLYTAREGLYGTVVEEGRPFPAHVAALTNMDFRCSPAATIPPDATYVVEVVTATASFRFGKSRVRWFERSGARVVVGEAGLTVRAYRAWFVPHEAVSLATVGYGLGATYGTSITRVVDSHWLRAFALGLFGETTPCQDEVV
jgi:L(+)-tartrate dehydratase beta subunit